jgi:hypothetical protein
VADSAAAWTWAADPHPAETCPRLIDPLLGIYQRQVHGLLDAHAALAQADQAKAAEWAAAEVVAARPVVAAVLAGAATTGQAEQARELAAVYLDATRMLDGRGDGAREAERFIGPVLAVANAVGDAELADSARGRLGPDGDPEAGKHPDSGGGTGRSPAPRPDSPKDTLSAIQGEPRDAEVPGRPVLFGARA